MRSLAVRVLGEFQVAGVETAALGSRKGRAMLRLLALARGQAVAVDTLAAALWGDAPPARPADQVGVLVSRLRGVLGRDRLEHTDAGYRLRYDWLDADELADLVAEIERRLDDGNVRGAAAAARAALSLVRGEPAAGDPDGWTAARLAELDRLVARARRLGAAALTAAGHWLEAVDLAGAVLAQDPYDEDALRLLMRAHVAGGRPGSALAAYAAARERLAEDLGADPDGRTQALHEAILRGEPAEAAPPPPVDEPHLVGREPELRRLDLAAAGVRAGAYRLVVVEGEAGIGKTTLLRTWAAGRAAAGDTVVPVTCGPLDRALPLDGLLVAIAAHLRARGPQRAAEALGSDAPLLAPILGRPEAGPEASPDGGPDGGPEVGQDGAPDGAPDGGFDGGFDGGGAESRELPGRGLSGAVSEGVVGPFVLFAAVLRVLVRLAQDAPLVVVLDDAHRAGTVLADWLEFARRRAPALLVVAAVRAGERDVLPADERIELGPLDRAAAAALAGPADTDALYALSGGHPLFLAELAATAAGEPSVPASLVALVAARCDELDAAQAAMLRSAAILGPRLDLELLAAVLHRPVLELLADAEQAVARRLLVDGVGEAAGAFVFRHELVRAALSAGAPAAHRALLHREAGRVLARRPQADPLEAAEHARLGGDVVLAARFLRSAAVRAAERFDHASAEALLDDALELHEDADGRLERARVRTVRGRYPEALADVDRALAAGAAAHEVGAWASYFDRRFAAAARFAQDGELTAADPAVRARCLIVGGRTRHAAGDLAAAGTLLTEALAEARGPDRLPASAWLGVLHAHQSRSAEALRLLGPAARSRAGVEHTSATLHALLFTGLVQAATGRPAEALAAFVDYTDEVARRHVPRFAGRGSNCAGWVLRNLGAIGEGVERHLAALEVGAGTAELLIAAHEDLAEERLTAGDLDGAADRLRAAAEAFGGDLVFGWRLELKLELLRARLALAGGDAETALALAGALAARAEAMDVPRYVCVGRLVAARACAALGREVDLAAVSADLDLTDRSIALEAWWWTGETAAALRVPRWVDRAADAVARLAREAGDHGPGLAATAAPRLDAWRDAAG